MKVLASLHNPWGKKDWLPIEHILIFCLFKGLHCSGPVSSALGQQVLSSEPRVTVPYNLEEVQSPSK